jgi:Tfp pilus assembly protein PilN
MRAVNLLPDPRTDKRHDDGRDRLRSTKMIAVAAGAVLIALAVILGAAFAKAHSDVSDRQAKLEGVQSQVAAAQVSAAASAAAAGRADAHLAAVSTAASQRLAWDGLLDQLSRVMPRGAWLESLQGTVASSTSTSTPSTSSSTTTTTPSTAGTAPTGFVVTGYGRTQSTVARALEQLVLMPALSDVTLQSTERTDIGAKKAIKFTISANVRSVGGTP